MVGILVAKDSMMPFYAVGIKVSRAAVFFFRVNLLLQVFALSFCLVNKMFYIS